MRPDTVGFTRQVLERSPEAVVVFFGPEEAAIAQGAVAAGARGLIRGGEREDLVASVAKALMLLFRSSRAAVPLQRSEADDAQAEDGTGEAGPTGDAGTDSGDALAAHSADLAAGPVVAGATSAGNGASPAGGHGLDAATAAGLAVPTVATPTATASAAGASAGVASPPSAAVPVNGPRRLALTERELQVLRGMADGKSNAEIGRELYVSEDTVKTHARRLFRKLSARDRAHAVAAAFRAGLVR